MAPKGVQNEVFNRIVQYKADVASFKNKLVSFANLKVSAYCRHVPLSQTSNRDLREDLFSRQDQEEEEDPFEVLEL